MSTDLNEAQSERELRLAMWSQLEAAGGPNGVAPTILRSIGIYGGAQGIWVNKTRTAAITSSGHGVTVGILHTGASYADDLSEDCLVYHYPSTGRSTGRDISEVEATKEAGNLGLPIFVITYPSPNATVRDVNLGWVEDWDDRTRTFLIGLGPVQQTRPQRAEMPLEPFELTVVTARASRLQRVRVGQQRFQFRVFQRYGAVCAVCGLRSSGLIDAAHICSIVADGSNDPRNGIPLCPTHHRAFDLGLFSIEPDMLAVVTRAEGPSAADLGISNSNLHHLPELPHADALRWRWQQWQGDR